MEDNHVVDTSKAMEERPYLPWSSSRIDVANTCKYKFYKVYMDGVKEHSKSLTLGSLSHEIIAELLRGADPSIKQAEALLAQALPFYHDKVGINEAVDEIRAMIPYMCKFVQDWRAFTASKNITKYNVEKPYAITESMKRASFLNPKSIYFRGIVDLWCYDKENEELYIIDHKTNKSTMSSKKVKEHPQLLTYVAMLTFVYKLRWKRAHIALNFLRKGKLVWAEVTHDDLKFFMYNFINELKYIENALLDCSEHQYWPAETSYKCSWCSFKDTCPVKNVSV